MVVQSSQKSKSGLRANCLSYPEVLAQSIGNISLMATPAVNAPLVFASAGNGTWLAYVIATVGLVLVGLNINQFARRAAFAGTLYGAIAKSLGSAAGFLAGWALIPAYLCTAMAVQSGFIVYTNAVLNEFGFQLPAVLLFVISAIAICYFAYTDIQLSTLVMLLLEIIAVGLVLVLAIVVLVGHGFKVDTAQLMLQGTSPEGLRSGLVLAIFSYVGFESATTLGEESKRPRRFIPKAVIWSAVLAGIFFIAMSYIEVLGFSQYNLPLDKVNVPLDALANLAGLGLLGIALSVGVMLSFFACAIASVNAGARILYAMSRHRLLSASLSNIHSRNQTPHIAVFFSALLVFLVPTALSLLGVSNLDIYGYLGTFATYGFLLVYILISIAAPVELLRTGNLRPQDTVIAVLAFLFMLIPVIGSLYPIPPFPYNVIPYAFLFYLAIGWLLFGRLRPELITEMRRSLKATYNPVE